MRQARADWHEGHYAEAIKGFIRREWPVIAFVICFALIGVGVMRVKQLSEDNRQAIRVSCHLLNRAITQSQGQGGKSTELLIAEIVEGMTPSERHAYEQAASHVVAGPQKNPCGVVAANAY